MKDKISKLKNLVKKYGLKGTVKKALDYIYSNYLVRLSLREWFLLHLHRKTFAEGIGRILERDTYDRIVIWRSSFGWDVPLYQRPQHIFSNFARQRTLVFYEVTRFTDDVKRMKKQADNLYLVTDDWAYYSYRTILSQDVAFTASDGVTLSEVSRDGTNAAFTYEKGSSDTDAYVDVSLNYYPYYHAVDEQGNELDTDINVDLRLRVLLPEDSSGSVTIRFETPALWRVGDAVSLIAICGLAALAVLSWRKRKEA